VERRLELVDAEHRGFAYEGATMAFTVRDAMAGGLGRRTRDLLRGPGSPHIFLAYIGIGFAMSHLPRPLWRRVVPDLSGDPYYPTMSWLAVDGYGFDKAYFQTDRWVWRQRRPASYAWEGRPDYFLRAVDQGIGRALWFIHGGAVPDILTTVRRFATQRQADLFAGVGLAATFAGGTTFDDLVRLRDEAPEAAADLAQGAVFAAKARVHAGYVPAHTDQAAAALTGMGAASCAELADDEGKADLTGDAEPAYEVWRRRIRHRFIEREAA
jgi:hypothetical protein